MENENKLKLLSEQVLNEADMKTKILDDMLAKGYINEERYQKWKLDEHFSKNDSTKYQYLFNAYANIDNGNYTLDDFRRTFSKWLRISIKLKHRSINNI